MTLTKCPKLCRRNTGSAAAMPYMDLASEVVGEALQNLERQPEETVPASSTQY